MKVEFESIISNKLIMLDIFSEKSRFITKIVYFIIFVQGNLLVGKLIYDFLQKEKENTSIGRAI